jgi:hypothetical protein
MKKIIGLFIIVFLSNQANAGGGWPQPYRRGYFKLAQNFIGSSYFYNSSGVVVESSTINLLTTSIYGEYGFTDRFTGIVYLPFFVRHSLTSQNNLGSDLSLQHFGDTDITFKYALIIDKPIVVSASVLLGLPLGKSFGTGQQILQTGDGEFNQMVRIDASHSFYPKPIYVSMYAAFNNRTRNFSDEIRFGAEVGFTFKKFIPVLKLNIVQSLFNGTVEEVQNGVFSNNTEYVSPTLELNYQLNEKWGLSGSGGFAFAGRNILASPNWSLGIYFKL